ASEIKRLPAESRATPKGVSGVAVADAPDVAHPKLPLPATVLMVPPTTILRTRLLPWSATQMLPAASTAIPHGRAIEAAVAGPPSPAKVELPLPAIVVMTPLGETLRMRWFKESA